LNSKYEYHPEQQNSLPPLSCDLLCNFIPVGREGLAFATLFAAKRFFSISMAKKFWGKMRIGLQQWVDVIIIHG
jgi:hypothetical protein